jgi:tripartite-type tricarboxylate transporter receptor subunit TctC
METTMKLPHSLSLLRMFAVALGLMATPLMAQPWPNKPVRIIVPFPPGGTTDVVARLLGQRLSEQWGQSVVIENRTGAGGNIGADVVAKAPADGYTLLMSSGSIVTVNPTLYKKMPFDAAKDFAYITKVAQGPMLITVSKTLPVKNLKEFIALAKKDPGRINFGSAGVGSQTHMATENLMFASGTQLTHVPYKGEGPALTDLAGNQIQMIAANFTAAIGFVRQDKVRALAVTSKTRAPQIAEVPTAAESGLPGFEYSGWFGLLAPASTPREVIDKVYRDTVSALDSTDMRARLYVQGLSAVANTPDAFVKSVNEEAALWARIIRERNLSAGG